MRDRPADAPNRPVFSVLSIHSGVYVVAFSCQETGLLVRKESLGYDEMQIALGSCHRHIEETILRPSGL